MGFRFGWSLWAYVPAILALGYLTMDAAVVLLAETTVEARVEGIIETEDESAASARRTILHNAATYIKQRGRRFILATLMVINSLLWFAVVCWSVWGLWSPRLGRPICADDETEWFVYWRFYPKTIGGWKQDWDAQYSESLSAALQIFILFSLPAARQYASRSARGTGGQTGVEAPARAKPNRFVAVLERSLRTPRFTILIIIGIVVIIIGNAFVGSAFGNAWARAIAGEPDLNWNEVTIADYIYEITLGTLLTILAGGLTLRGGRALDDRHAVVPGGQHIPRVGCVCVCLLCTNLLSVPVQLLFRQRPPSFGLQGLRHGRRTIRRRV